MPENSYSVIISSQTMRPAFMRPAASATASLFHGTIVLQPSIHAGSKAAARAWSGLQVTAAARFATVQRDN